MITSRVSVLPELGEAGVQVARSLADLTIDALEFAREGRSTAGAIPVMRLSRLQELLSSVAPEAALMCELSGRREGRSFWLRLQVQGELKLVCQRCLGSLPYALAVDTELQVIPEGQPWPDEKLEDGDTQLGADAIAADAELAVIELIEDEVLLALPIAPRHDEGNKACVPPANTQATQEEKQAASPFAVLAQLKKH